MAVAVLNRMANSISEEVTFEQAPEKGFSEFHSYGKEIELVLSSIFQLC